MMTKLNIEEGPHDVSGDLAKPVDVAKTPVQSNKNRALLDNDNQYVEQIHIDQNYYRTDD
jgi:hypothetical protein